MQKTYFTSFKAEVEAGKREVVSIITTDAIDRDNEIVLPSGMKKKNFAGNPVVCVDHDYSISSVVGKNLWLKVEGNKIIAKTYITDKTQTGRDLFGLIQDGIVSAVSIGMAVSKYGPPTEKEIKGNPSWAGARNVIREWDLLEYSYVAIPANPQALTLAVSKGYSPETLKLLGLEDDLQSLNVTEKTKAEVSKAYGIPADALDSLPEPKFYREVDLSGRVNKLLKTLNPDEIMDRYRGRI